MTDNIERRRRYEECRQQVLNYQGQFPDVPTMTSEQLVEILQGTESSNLTIVDVRTAEEQAVSKIPGAIPLHKLRIQPNPNDEDQIAVYCTVGYRSGREARRLQETYPQWKGKIFNLDGILAYSFVEGAPSLVTTTTTTTAITSGDATTTTTTSNPKPTKRLHTYGPNWNCANPDFEAVWFQKTSFVGHVCQTVCCSVGRMCQHYASVCRSSRSKRES
ncbi:rhodanese-like domain containing protein [Nitzschia inconspicua]|uniref:Rhodanese-like domain containing protein n=1 Tax=Nitzschia inconspicua TaxID=303405 RepID=A0A9K3Q876_9STRA|nr:rhodanese-like domain containing protein [Nitzschia inconspicua]